MKAAPVAKPGRPTVDNLCAVMQTSTDTGSPQRFPVRSLPDATPVIHSISERTDFREQCARVKPAAPIRGLISLKLPADLFEGLRAAADEAIRRHGVHGWLSEEGRSVDDIYLSMSLTHNTTWPIFFILMGVFSSAINPPC